MAAKADTAQLHASNLAIERAGEVILADVSLTVSAGDRIGLVGPNGSGKSSLMEALAGRLRPSAGAVSTVPTTATVGLLSQELDAEATETIADYVARRVGVTEASDQLDAATDALAEGGSEAMAEHQRCLDRWLRLGGADLDARLGAALARVGFESTVAEERAAEQMSGGEQARVGLAALLLARHDVLLLDEPTNNLDRAGLDQLEAIVLGTSTPMMIVSHDRRFLDRTVTSIVELDPHHRSATIYGETWAHYLEARELAKRQAAARYDDFATRRSALVERADQQRRWAQQGVRAERRAPDNDRMARGARIDRTEQQAAKARQTERALDRLEVVDKPWAPWSLQFSIGQAERSGDLVAELRLAEVDFGAFRLGPISLVISAGDRVAVLGANGHGKTTLLAALLGEIEPTAGEQRLGRSVIVGRLDQARTRLTSDGPFIEAFSNETGLVASEARNVLAKFGLGAEHLSRPSIRWSPGERTRAVLAAFQATGVNTLVLDEPTNHLDLEAIEQLEAAVDRFEGTVLLVTHDQAFLDAVRLTRTLTIEDGRLTADEPA